MISILFLSIFLLFTFNTIISQTYTLFDGHLECRDFFNTKVCTPDVVYYPLKKIHILLSINLLEYIPGTQEYKFKCINDYLKSTGKQPGEGICAEACGQYFCAD